MWPNAIGLWPKLTKLQMCIILLLNIAECLCTLNSEIAFYIDALL